MKKKVRTLLLILLVVAMFLQPTAMAKAEAKSHHKHSSHNKIIVMECTKNRTRVKYNRNHLNVPDAQVIMLGNKTGYLLLEEYTFIFEIDRKGHLKIELYPGGDAGLYLPGRGYIPKEYPVRIGHSSIYVYGWVVPQLTRDYYRNGKHYVDITIESPGYVQKIRFVRKGKTWTLTALH